MNWAERIEAAKDVGHFSLEDKALAEGWAYCAIGEKYDLGNRGGIPESHSKANHLGMRFANSVLGNHPFHAEEIYSSIQELSGSITDLDFTG